MVIIFYGHIAYYVTRKREKQIFLNIKNSETNDKISIKKLYIRILNSF